MNSLPEKLLGHPYLKGGESLASFLIRLGKANFYEPPGILAELIFEGAGDEAFIKDRLDLPRQVTVFERITRLAQAEPLQLYAASAHRFARVITPPESKLDFLDLPEKSVVSLLPEGVAQKLLRPASACQYCPLCVKQAPYHRLNWVVIATAACLEHKCLLVNQCYNCQRPLQVLDIVNAGCSKCGVDLGKAPCVYIHGDEIGLLAQQVIQAWLFNTSVSLDSDCYMPLRSPRVLFRLIDGLRCTAQRLAISGWTYLHTLPVYHNSLEASFELGSRSLTPYQSYCVYSTAFQGILHWPKGFYEFLDAHYGQRDETVRASSIRKDLGSTYSHWLQRTWRHAEFDFVQEAFNLYITKQYGISASILHSNRFRNTPGLLDTFSEVSINYAAELVGVTPSTLQRFTRAGQLEMTKDDPIFVRQADVLKLYETWNSSAGLKEAAHVLGVSEDIVLAMVAIGLLASAQNPATGFQSWQFNEKDLYQLLEKIKSQTKVHTEQGRVNFFSVSLICASRITTQIGLNAASILARVADGTLQAYRLPSSEFSCKDLLFDPNDLSAYIEAVKEERGWMSRKEVTKRLKIKDGTLAKWVRAGLLVPAVVHINAQYFDKATVEKFIVDHVTSEGAAKLLGIGILAVQRWVRQGRLQAVSGPGIDECHDYLFRKESLLQWRNGRLSFGEALDLLGVSASTLHRWTGEGKITPLDDMGGKQRWFPKETVLRLNQEMEQKNALLT